MPFNKDEFIKAFEGAIKRKKGTGNVVCPMCSDNHWQLPGGYTVSSLQNELGGIRLGGPAIPKVPIICSNCGFVAEIAIGILGLLPKEEVLPKTQDVTKPDTVAEKNS